MDANEHWIESGVGYENIIISNDESFEVCIALQRSAQDWHVHFLGEYAEGWALQTLFEKWLAEGEGRLFLRGADYDEIMLRHPGHNNHGRITIVQLHIKSDKRNQGRFKNFISALEHTAQKLGFGIYVSEARPVLSGILYARGYRISEPARFKFAGSWLWDPDQNESDLYSKDLFCVRVRDLLGKDKPRLHDVGDYIDMDALKGLIADAIKRRDNEMQ